MDAGGEGEGATRSVGTVDDDDCWREDGELLDPSARGDLARWSATQVPAMPRGEKGEVGGKGEGSEWARSMWRR